MSHHGRRSHGRGFQLAVLTALFALIGANASAHTESADEQRFIQVAAKTKEERTKLAEIGVSIEFVRSDSVWGFASKSVMADLKASGVKILGDFDMEVARGGHQTGGMGRDFPSQDARFHNYQELKDAMNLLAGTYADIVRVHSIGKSLEGRDILAIHINTSESDLLAQKSSKPGIILMGTHHAREHLSTEIPLMLAQHLLKNRTETSISSLLENRDIWIIPMVNPDGVEYDIASGSYRMWRKNRRNNGNGTYGVDLNRNYGYGWGTGGSSTNPSSDTYMGKAPFSEPETQTIRDFVTSKRDNVTMVISYHTFSELILYPWGGKYDDIENERDRRVHEIMAQQMAQWNGYTPQQSSDLYIASGDTCDWAYGELGKITFTFELSPKSQWNGGFYPGAGVIDRVFQDNLRPMLYMIDLADDPYRVLNNGQREDFLKHYRQPDVTASVLGL